MVGDASAGADEVRGRGALWVSAGVIAALGCTPTYDWREVRPEGAAIVALFPCRPQQHARTADLAGMRLPMRLNVCNGGKETWALAVTELEHPNQMGAALLALRTTAAANFSATQVQTSPLQVLGLTPHENAMRVTLRGVSAQGAPVDATVVVFAKGLRVYQATVFGVQIDPELSEMFFSGLKLE